MAKVNAKARMAAYSGTPLAKKLGIREDMPLAVLNAPKLVVRRSER